MSRHASRPLMLAQALAVVVTLGITGCGGGGGNNNSSAALNDDFQAISSGVWDVNASVATIGGKLQLKGSSASTAEVCSGESFQYKPMTVLVSSDTWSAGTIAGYDSTVAGVRQAIIIHQGKLVIINQSATGTKQAAVDITNWSTLRSAETAYTIKWQAGKVELFAGTALVATYTGPLVPSVDLKARFACDQGKLTIDRMTVSDGLTPVVDEPFTSLNIAIWDVIKGSLVTTSGGKLLLRSTAQAAAEVRSKGEFAFKEMDFSASGDWGSDTSIGFERPETGGAYTIEVTNGKYRVSSPAGSRAEDIANWTATKSQNSAFRIKWQNGFSQLIVNNFLNGSYSGDYLATGAAKVRFKVGTAQPGEMLIDSVLVKDTLL